MHFLPSPLNLWIPFPSLKETSRKWKPSSVVILKVFTAALTQALSPQVAVTLNRRAAMFEMSQK